jgi:ADP-ribose pyrophosphatase YjhB (NUDIX family)
MVRDGYCSFCGSAFAPPLAYPRTCASCHTQIWSNPIPVSVILLPVLRQGDRGLLVITRAIAPQIGKLALPGGFLEDHETVAQGGVREVEEEADVVIDPALVSPFWFTSTAPRPNRVLLFSVAADMKWESLPPFTANSESSHRGVVFGPDGLDAVFAFDLHAQAVKRYFATHRISGEHRHEAV